MTLKTICQQALNEIGGFEVPTAYFGSSNVTAKLALNLVQRAGNSLERRHRWAELVTEHTFVTVADTANYSLPTDFRAFANMSLWDRTNYNPMLGPMSPAEWQFMKSSVAGDTGTVTRWFRVKGTQIYIHPTPTASGDTIAFDYYSRYWISGSASSAFIAAFESDSDTCLLDEDLLTLDLKWRFLQAKGMPFDTEFEEWKVMRDVRLASYGGARKLSLDMPALATFPENVPDTGYGGV